MTTHSSDATTPCQSAEPCCHPDMCAKAGICLGSDEGVAYQEAAMKAFFDRIFSEPELRKVPVWWDSNDVDAPITNEIVGNELISTYHDGRVRILKRPPMKDETP